MEKRRPPFKNFQLLHYMRPLSIIDTNVSFGHWPWMDFSDITAQGLQAQFERQGIQEAWISHTESILYPDPDIPDDRLIAAFRSCPNFVPVKTINLLMGNWRESLSRALALGMRLVKIYPNYHQYSLLSSAAMEMAAALTEKAIPLLIPLRVEDERNQYPLMKVESVRVDQIISLAAAHPNLRILVLGAQVGEIAQLTLGAANIFCDLSFAETADVMERLLSSAPSQRILFGSHTPFFYTQATVRKLQKSSISEEIKHAIAYGNARAFLSTSPDCPP